MKKILLVVCAGLIAMNFTALAQSDFKIKKKSRMDIPGMPAPVKNPVTGELMDFSKLPDSTVFIKSGRMLTQTRFEKNKTGSKEFIMSQLRQCDLGRELSYDSNSKKYQVTNFSAAPKTSGTDKATNKENGGSVIFSIIYTDTGERAQMFGYPARHIKSVLTTKPAPDACQKKAMKVETDGWYIDLPTFSCPLVAPPEQPDVNGGATACNDKVIYQINGKAETGFAVKETMKMTFDGMQPMTMAHDVTEITKTDLDSVLFDIPPGYTEEKDSRSKNAGNTAPDNFNDNNSSSAMTVNGSASPPLPPNWTAASKAALPPKKPGVIRIGIAKPNMKLPDSKNDTTAPLELSAAVRDSLMTNLKTETVEAIRLETDAPEAEAKQKECDYIFYANVTQKRGGGMFGKMVAMGVLSTVGMIVPGVGGMIAGTVGNIAMSETMGKAAKAKDEFTFDYKITDLTSAVLSQALTKAKTKKDGEDVLTPQIKQASIVVLGEIAKKK